MLGGQDLQPCFPRSHWYTIGSTRPAAAKRCSRRCCGSFRARPCSRSSTSCPPTSARVFGTTRIHTSALQRAPWARRWFRYAAALAPALIERLDTSGYDIVVSDSHAIAKGVRKRPAQVHVCYCHTPARFAWTMAETYGERAAGDSRFRGALTRRAQARFRAWDVAASRNVDHFVANSRHIADTIARCYGRDATVIYPPVDIERFRNVGTAARSGYVTVSRLVPYKRIDVIIDAFARMPDRRLTIVGDGPERAAPRAKRCLPT